MKKSLKRGIAIFIGILFIFSISIYNFTAKYKQEIKLKTIYGEAKEIDNINIGYLNFSKYTHDDDYPIENQFKKNPPVVKLFRSGKKMDTPKTIFRNNKPVFEINGEIYTGKETDSGENIYINGQGDESEHIDGADPKDVYISIKEEKILEENNNYFIRIDRDSDLYKEIRDYNKNNTSLLSFDRVDDKLYFLLKVENTNEIDTVKNNIQIKYRKEKDNKKIDFKVPDLKVKVHLIEYNLNSKKYMEKSSFEFSEKINIDFKTADPEEYYQEFKTVLPFLYKDKYIIFTKINNKKIAKIINIKDGNIVSKEVEDKDNLDIIFNNIDTLLHPLYMSYDEQKDAVFVVAKDENMKKLFNMYIKEKNGEIYMDKKYIDIRTGNEMYNIKKDGTLVDDNKDDYNETEFDEESIKYFMRTYTDFDVSRHSNKLVILKKDDFTIGEYRENQYMNSIVRNDLIIYDLNKENILYIGRFELNPHLNKFVILEKLNNK